MAAKGIWGPVTLTEGSGDTATKVIQAGWHFHPGLSNMQETPLIANVTNWQEFLDGKDVAGWMSQPDRQIAPNTPIFFRADFTMAADPMLHQPLSLRTTGLQIRQRLDQRPQPRTLQEQRKPGDRNVCAGMLAQERSQYDGDLRR